MFSTSVQINQKMAAKTKSYLAWTLSTTSIKDGAPYFMAYIQRKTSKPSISDIKKHGHSENSYAQLKRYPVSSIHHGLHNTENRLVN